MDKKKSGAFRKVPCMQFCHSAQTHQTHCKVAVALKLEDAHFVKYTLSIHWNHASKNGFDAYYNQKVDMRQSIYIPVDIETTK